jgi:hypothetical protein
VQGHCEEIPPEQANVISYPVLVIKKDGVSWRLVNDGREGNRIVIIRHAIGEDLRSQLQYIRGSEFFYNIDPKEDYTQLSYRDPHGIYVLFINGRYYRQKRLGMGIINAVYILQVLVLDAPRFRCYYPIATRRILPISMRIVWIPSF